MAWQIQCKQHFLKQLYTLNNQLESEKTVTWHEDVQMYCWDCMRVRGGVRGAMFCCWICMRVYESMRFCESCWERFCESCWGSVIQVAEGVRVVWCSQNILWYIWELCEVWEFFIASQIFSKYIPKTNKTWTWPSDNRHDQVTDMAQTYKALKIESLRLGFTFHS